MPWIIGHVIPMRCEWSIKNTHNKKFSHMAASKQFLANYLLKSPASGESHHLVGSSLEVVMDKFNTLASPNYRNFVSRSKRFSRNRMWTMDSIMALKDHSAFKFVHGSWFPGQSKDKMFVFKMFVDLLGSGVELVKNMQVGGKWRIHVLCLIMSNVWKTGRQWLAICTTVDTVKCWSSHAVTCNLKMMQHKNFFRKNWILSWQKMVY